MRWANKKITENEAGQNYLPVTRDEKNISNAHNEWYK